MPKPRTLIPATAAILLHLLKTGTAHRTDLENAVRDAIGLAPITIRIAMGELRKAYLLKGGVRRPGRQVRRGVRLLTDPVELTLKGRELAERERERVRKLV